MLIHGALFADFPKDGIMWNPLRFRRSFTLALLLPAAILTSAATPSPPPNDAALNDYLIYIKNDTENDVGVSIIYKQKGFAGHRDTGEVYLAPGSANRYRLGKCDTVIHYNIGLIIWQDNYPRTNLMVPPGDLRAYGRPGDEKKPCSDSWKLSASNSGDPYSPFQVTPDADTGGVSPPYFNTIW
ncbi:hypothetical protein [Streptosporangium vulgare]|uniref:LTD domain-containing protein n=1 Tax=Streptosporangium vulgare TaxID=46190 RepID=A0ABV5TE88_9ACTN